MSNDTEIRRLERLAVQGDVGAAVRLDRMKSKSGIIIPGYYHLIGNRILLLGARWHYEGVLVGTRGIQLIIEDCRHVFNYSMSDGISASDTLPGQVICNHTHVASACLSPFSDKKWKVIDRPPVLDDTPVAYDDIIGKKIFLLGARWHYSGDLIGCAGDYFFLENAIHIFNYTLENGISAKDDLPGIVAVNITHVASTCFSPFAGPPPPSSPPESA